MRNLALLWLAAGAKKLTPSTLRAINEAAAVYISAISGFEIALKAATGKLKLPKPAAEWLEAVLQHHGIVEIPLGISQCIVAAELPRIHDDPCDRFIIAAAKLNDLPVVTADERFERYGVGLPLRFYLG
jgi:PIN domain nuclease of toxin-antitoxin system